MYSVIAIFNSSVVWGNCNRQVHRDFLITLYFDQLNVVTGTIFLRVLQIQVRSRHIHHLIQVHIHHVSY